MGVEAPDHGITVDTSDRPYGRLAAYGNQLIDTHIRLAALLESHFTYEEKRLVAALNEIGDG